ncbi:response regulator transcription factor [Mediterraneibacter glycyrrhizinilyticus]|uniref:response regulator transcription factor n=1 Tax=Mediterraneibacter glycyrrhizinilyticus TaxID=342942 RepID=UPI0025AB4958|nr:response regulator transcription factor [Mediterraneibacter glycyrrhizinilyticus]MDN0044436.1 response regulator transcription factor [Mediterraneibacter glycyrrhizinilyticus]
MKTILIVDDDVYIGDMLEELLTKENYDVGRAYSGTEALMYLSSRRPDLILLDLMLPGLSGEELLPLIKGIPVIVVSAKAEVSDKVSLLLGGAADYVTKPFDTSELLARITVQLRKNDVPESSDILSYDTIRLNTETRAVTVSDTPVRLTQTEYAILKLLMANPSQVITKSVMLDRISEDTPDCTESSLKVHISNLRKKLKAVNGKDYIEAIWGIGFKLNEEL